MAMKTDQLGLLEEEESSYQKQKITQVFVDKVKSTTHFQHTDHMDSSTSVVDERNKKGNGENPLTRVDWQHMKTYVRKLPLENEKEVFKGSSSKETSCLMANNGDGTKSYDECNTKEKISLTGIWRRENGRYAAVIKDRIRHKKIWLGTFDTVDEASQAYFSKKSEFEKLSQGNKEDKLKKKCDQIRQPESPPIVASFSMANDQTFNTASGNGRDKRIDSHKSTTHLIGAHKGKAPGKYTSRITNPITKKKIWLGTFDTAEEASRAYHSKKLEFEKLVKARQQQCSNKQTHSKQDAGEEKLVTVKQGHENVNCHEPLPESAGGSKINVLITNSSNIGTDQRIDSHEIGTGEEAFCQKKQVFLGTVKEASKVFNPCLIANVNGAESSDECNTTTSCDPKSKRSFIGVQRQKSGRYAAVITDRIKHTKVWLGTFDTAEEASQAYFSKNSELEKLSQHGNKMNKPKKNSDQIQPDSPVVKTLNIASWGRTKKRTDSQGKIPGSSKETSCLMANVHGTKSSDMCNTTRSCDPKAKRSLIGIQKQKNGRYAAAITDRIRHKKVCLGTFGTIEEASQAYQPKKLEFQKLVKAKQNQCANKQIPSKQDKKSEEVVNVKQGRNINCELKSVGGSEIDVPISNSSKGRADQRIDSHEIGTAEEAFHAYQSKKFDSQSSKEVELKGNMPTDSSAGEKQEGQEDDKDLWMGEWVQLPGNRAVKFSLKLGLPIIDNYGSLLGEFSTLDDLSIC